MWTILSKPDCPYCDMAKDLILKCEGGNIESIDVTHADSAVLLSLLKLAFERPTVPQVFAPNGAYIGSYSDLKVHFGVDESGANQV